MEKNTIPEIKIELFKRGITQQQVAESCGVSKSFVCMYLNGQRKSS
jgi:predicted transcriptional regulator